MMATPASVRTRNRATANHVLVPLSSDFQARKSARTSRDRAWLHRMRKRTVLRARVEPDEQEYAPEADRAVETCGRARRATRISRQCPWLGGMQKNLGWDVPVEPKNQTSKPTAKNLNWGTAVEPDEQIPTPPTEYFVAPNPLRHYYLNFLLKTVENCIHAVAQKTFGKKLASREWKQDKLGLTEFSRHAYRYNTSRFIDKDWPNADTVEVEDWIFFFNRMHHELPKGTLAGSLPSNMVSTVLASAHENLRQAAMHRQGSMTMDDLLDVMRTPELLQNHQRAEDVRQVYKVVCGDPTVDEHPRSVIEQLILSPNRPPYTTFLEVHTKIENLQEEACFRYWRRELSEGNPEGRRKHPEDMDLRDRYHNWYYAPFHPCFDCEEKILDLPDVDGRLFQTRAFVDRF